MSRAHLAWAGLTSAVALAYLALRARFENFISLGPIDITPTNLGEIAFARILLSACYPLRKRIAIGAPGSLDAWLWMHIYLGALGLMFAWFHSRQRFSPDQWLPNAALLLLLAGSLSGVVQRLAYVVVARRLAALPDYDSPARLAERIADLGQQATAYAEYRSAAFQATHQLLQGRGARRPVAADIWRLALEQQAALQPHERADFTRMLAALRERDRLLGVMLRRRALRSLLDRWFTIHAWLTLAGLMLMLAHAFDSLVIIRKWS